METYYENKQSLQKIIRRVMAVNSERGKYLKKHLVFDDKTHTIQYSGAISVLDKLMKEAKIFN